MPWLKMLLSRKSGRVTDRWRAVFDTNIYLSAVLSQNERSPSRELLARLAQNEFDLLTCRQLLDELIEKLLERSLTLKECWTLWETWSASRTWSPYPPKLLNQ